MLDGHVHPDFYPVAQALEQQIKKTGGGAAACAYHDGKCILDIWGGVRDEDGTPWQRDTMSVSYSTTKGVVSTALHILADRGLLDYDDKVAKHWPEFAQAGKQDVTIRDVLCHRAGLYNIREMLEHANELRDWDAMTRALAAATPAPLADDHSAYHALTFGHIVGEIVQRVSGRALRDVIREDIATPLGLDGLYIGAPDHELERAARLVGRPPTRTNGAPVSSAAARKKRQRELMARGVQSALRLGGFPADFKRTARALAPKGISEFDFSANETLQASIPSANGLFTARSLARMYAALANGGELDGVRLLSQETMARATEVQVHGPDEVIIFPMRWRLGYHRVSTYRGRLRKAFGHFGYGGSGAWADPRRKMSFAMVLNAGTGTPLGDLRMLKLNTALIVAAKQRWKKQGSPRDDASSAWADAAGRG